MENTDNMRCMFMGLPNSGKSSFIGAFWHVVESNEIKDSYTVDVQPIDREYLNELRESFLGCKSPDRTKTDFIKHIDLSIKDNQTGKSAKFTFPDLSGETFESQFEYRKITVDYLTNISECESIMLFVNPQFLKKPDLIADAIAMLDGDDETSEDVIVEIEAVEWVAKMCQSQVMLVDLLQMVANRLIKPCKISLIVSAWDLILNIPEIVEPRKTPKEWISINLPLLDQYLTANSKIFTYKVFGVSAQGANYSESEGGNKQLLSFAKQSERIKVQDGNTVSNDITVPFKWLING